MKYSKRKVEIISAWKAAKLQERENKFWLYMFLRNCTKQEIRRCQTIIIITI